MSPTRAAWPLALTVFRLVILLLMGTTQASLGRGRGKSRAWGYGRRGCSEQDACDSSLNVPDIAYSRPDLFFHSFIFPSFINCLLSAYHKPGPADITVYQTATSLSRGIDSPRWGGGLEVINTSSHK